MGPSEPEKGGHEEFMCAATWQERNAPRKTRVRVKALAAARGRRSSGLARPPLPRKATPGGRRRRSRPGETAAACGVGMPMLTKPAVARVP